MDTIYAEMFEKMLVLWQHVIDKKGAVAREFPDDLAERIESVDKDLALLKEMIAKRNAALGIGDQPPEEFIEEHKDILPKRELQFFNQIEQMKKEIGFVSSLMRQVSLGKKKGDKPMLSGQEATEKGALELIRKRKRRLKRTGANEKWIPM